MKDVIKIPDWQKEMDAIEEQNRMLRGMDEVFFRFRKEEQWDEWRSAYNQSMQSSEAQLIETKLIREAVGKAQGNEDRQRLLRWLRGLGGNVNDVDYSFYFNKNTSARAAVDNIGTGAYTGDWVLSHCDFKTWVESTGNSFLWLRGRVGSGKSVLR